MLLKRGQEGKLELLVLPVTLAEVYHVLRRLYHFEVLIIKETLLALIGSQAFEVENESAVLQALTQMSGSIGFEDAYLAARARLAGGAVASFDNDFKRLKVERLEPPGENEE